MGRITETAVAYRHLLGAELGTLMRKRSHEVPVRRVALLADWLPPGRIMGGSYRPTSFLQYASANGWHATALTRELTEHPDRAALELASRIPPECVVIRVPPVRFRASRRVYPRIDGTVEMALQIFECGRRCLDSAAPTVVVATGPHFHNFLAAFYIARHFQSKLVLDYRDEWTECPFEFVTKTRWDRYFEMRVLRRADGVLFTTRSQLEHALCSFPVLGPSRCFLVPNGWDRPRVDRETPRPTRPAERPSRVVVSFVGNLAPHTHPGPFLDMLEELLCHRPETADRIRLRLVGRVDASIQERLGRFAFPAVIEHVGQVPFSEAQREMRSADILILFAGADLARYLPGKLFEYLAARRPIMIYGAPGEAANLVTSLGVGRRIEGEAAFMRFLDDLEDFRSPVAGAAIEEWLGGHQRDVLARRFFEILDRITAGQGAAEDR